MFKNNFFQVHRLEEEKFLLQKSCEKFSPRQQGARIKQNWNQNSREVISRN